MDDSQARRARLQALRQQQQIANNCTNLSVNGKQVAHHLFNPLIEKTQEELTNSKAAMNFHYYSDSLFGISGGGQPPLAGPTRSTLNKREADHGHRTSGQTLDQRLGKMHRGPIQSPSKICHHNNFHQENPSQICTQNSFPYHQHTSQQNQYSQSLGLNSSGRGGNRSQNGGRRGIGGGFDGSGGRCVITRNEGEENRNGEDRQGRGGSVGGRGKGRRGGNNGGNNGGGRGGGVIDVFVKPSMWEDPWAELVRERENSTNNRFCEPQRNYFPPPPPLMRSQNTNHAVPLATKTTPVNPVSDGSSIADLLQRSLDAAMASA